MHRWLRYALLRLRGLSLFGMLLFHSFDAVANDNSVIGFAGRLQLDSDKTQVNGVTTNEELKFRRFWVNAFSQSEDWKYVARVDLGADRLDNQALVTLSADYHGLSDRISLKAGRFKTQFAMNWITSNSHLNIAERSALVELHKFGSMDGIQLYGSINRQVNYWVGVYDKSDFSGTAVIGRLVYSINHPDGSYYHLGTGVGVSSERDSMNTEFGYGQGAFHLQAEYFKTDFANNLHKTAKGYYLEAGYFLNESMYRPYQNGIYGAAKPLGKFGDWQLVARYESGDGNFSDIGLGRVDGKAYLLGINWYLNSQTKLMLSYLSGKQKLAPEVKGEEFRVRAQYSF